jgi:hypothetical protein
MTQCEQREDKEPLPRFEARQRVTVYPELRRPEETDEDRRTRHFFPPFVTVMLLTVCNLLR